MSKDDNNPFNNFDLGDMMKSWSENPFVKSIMENDFVKKMTNGEPHETGMEEVLESQRKNLETLKAMNEKAAEGLSKLAEQQSQMMNEAMNGVKSQATGAESSVDGKFDEAQEVFKRAVSSMASIGEAVKDAGEGVLEIVSTRMKESMAELEALIEKFKK